MTALRAKFKRFKGRQRTAWKLFSSKLRRRLFRNLTVIGVTGSSGKSTTVGILRTVLGDLHPVAATRQANGRDAVARLFRRMPWGTRMVVAEAGAGGEPDIAAIARYLEPDVAVVTLVALEHASRFKTVENVANEKSRLVAALRPGGLAVLNGDDPLVSAMADATGARVVRFGRGENCDLRITGVERHGAEGISVHVEGMGPPLSVRSPLFGTQFAVSIAAAVATARALGVPDAAIVSGVANYRGIITRCGVMAIDGGPTFIIDTAKAPFHSIAVPMAELAAVPAPRRTIVLGSISDSRYKSRRTYRRAVDFAFQHADRVFMSGSTGTGWASPDVPEGKTFARIDDILELATHLRETAIEGEVILLKSSGVSHLERIALSFRETVRCTSPDCGITGGCFSCGLYGLPFHEQPRRRSERRRLAAKVSKPEYAALADRPLGG